MSRTLGLVLLLVIFGIQPVRGESAESESDMLFAPLEVETADDTVAANDNDTEAEDASEDASPTDIIDTPAVTGASPVEDDDESQEIEIPYGIRNNQYYLESIRLSKLAQETYDYGDFDVSAALAQEAIRYAVLSDEFVALQLKIKEAGAALAAAQQRLNWAASSGAAKRYPAEYEEAGNWYSTGENARQDENWDAAIEAAYKVVEILAYIEAPPGSKTLPAQYTVRSWTSSRDCFWNIASRPWAYGDSRHWRLLYNANKSKLPQPDNPNLLEPGTVLDIPSIKGETRQGMWEPDR